MSASDTERREELAQLYPDVMRIAAGLAANPHATQRLWDTALRNGVAGEALTSFVAMAIIEDALLVVQAGRRRCFEEEPAETGGAA